MKHLLCTVGSAIALTVLFWLLTVEALFLQRFVDVEFLVNEVAVGHIFLEAC